MDEVTELADEHIRESESHLRHIDELFESAKRARAEKPLLEHEGSLLDGLHSKRDELAQVLDDVRGRRFEDWPDAVKHAPGLKGMFYAMRLQLEQLLTGRFRPGNRPF